LRDQTDYIDTAPWYGQGRSESNIGVALEGIPRQAFYMATKIGRYELDVEKMFDFSAEKTMKSIAKSLDLMKLDYLDVCQVKPVLILSISGARPRVCS